MNFRFEYCYVIARQKSIKNELVANTYLGYNVRYREYHVDTLY